MTMYNPPHPGEFIAAIYLEPDGISKRELAQKLDLPISTVNRVLNSSSRITPEMALRLSKVVGRSPESWLAMQDTHDSWIAKRQINNLKPVAKLEFATV
uniref:Addiction module antidote protein, HigA family n=1 Tax=Candidatus Kentrum sp. MB TaxID=2138164 RepID=A0A450Y1M7_9GAMM|nr:MAG: addiction module antidote protein, HigA family [Candidatus Kentron sp. MB]VFK35439.1 MAG: addiction module antidote protein, HigA family [Candidatus Kentron sp. MB]VFK77299.1 MAG: addiction module antidote protein, HigA family [Candidatus Kentron sp. MB]